MLKGHQYNETIKKIIIAFGTLFNNIDIQRKNSDDDIIQSMKVPLAYGPKQKWLTLAKENDTQTKSVSITLPRMSFEINGLEYAPDRVQNRIHTLKKPNNDGTTNVQYASVPYNATIMLYVYAKNSDEGLQIIEQILPYFQPDYTVTIKDNNKMNGKSDVPVILTSVDFEDNYESDAISRRSIVWTLTFTAKFFLYGPITSQKIVKKVNVDQYTDMPDKEPIREQKYSVRPDPLTANSFDDDFGFNEMTSFYTDLPDEDI